ncbi:hypothetical protein LIER_13875 [Lithospermum erythrorhizon]|uniref:DUF4283 domain-containing protein n=1 Tax=Lithospermum erythrorhizon TaxID=34254 RepID=A0AAV3PX39_LITER
MEFQQKIEFQWIPPMCSHCFLFGHDLDHCNFGGKPPELAQPWKVKKIWQPNEQVHSVDLVHEVVVEVLIVDQLEKDSIVDGITEQLVVSPKVVLNVVNAFAVLNDDGKEEVSKEIAKFAGRKKGMRSN